MVTGDRSPPGVSLVLVLILPSCSPPVLTLSVPGHLFLRVSIVVLQLLDAAVMELSVFVFIS